MHIAICDDNVADRKHLERLLSRESDKRAGTPNILYVDSFGDKEHFLRNPLMYDMIFMDMTSTPTIAQELIQTLVQMGCDAPLILYSSKIDYTLLPNLPNTVVHMKKPYIPDPLPALLTLGDAHVVGNIETIPVPCDDGLQYIAKDNIYYCIPAEAGYVLCLTDGTRKNITIDISELQLLLQPYKEFCRIDKKHIANMRYVIMVSPISILMQDYHRLKISPLRYTEFKKLKKEMDEK